MHAHASGRKHEDGAAAEAGGAGVVLKALELASLAVPTLFTPFHAHAAGDTATRAKPGSIPGRAVFFVREKIYLPTRSQRSGI
jgi:hypothetical protein